MARPTKLTADVRADIADALKAGLSRELAAAKGGITYRTFRNWELRGERATRGRYFQFVQAVKEAEADAAHRWLLIIEQAALGTGAHKTPHWQAAAWKLERRFPQTYGRQITEHAGEVGLRVSELVIDDGQAGDDAADEAALARAANGNGDES